MPSLKLMVPFLALALPLSAQLQVAPGFEGSALALAKPPKGWFGLGLLPSGRLVSFDGQRLVTLDPGSGAVKDTLATLPRAVFGSDVRVGPTGGNVFFGDSESGDLWVVDVQTKRVRLAGNLSGNYAFAFHPHEGERFLYVSARPASSAQVFRVDTVSGRSDLIASAAGYSGPIEFDAAGNLYFAPAPTQFSKPKLGRLLRYTAKQVAGAIGTGSLTERDATRFATGFDNAFRFALDGEGTLYVADIFSAKTSSLLEIAPAGGTRYARNIVRFAGESVTAVTLAPGARPFERYGSPGSTLWLLSSDFASGNHLIRVRPARPRLAVFPSATPRRATQIRYEATRLPPSTVALWLFGAGLFPERPLLPLGAGGLRFPDFGVVLNGPVLAVATPIDAAGRTALGLRTPGAPAVQWSTQILAGPVRAFPGGTPASPWVSSERVTVVTQ